jgi:hypothetical protein
MTEGKFEVLKGPAGDGEAHSQPGAGIEVYSPPCYPLLPGNLLPPVNLATCTSTQRQEAQEQPISTWQPKTLPSVVATCCVVSDRSPDLCEEVVILHVFWRGSSFAKKTSFFVVVDITLEIESFFYLSLFITVLNILWTYACVWFDDSWLITLFQCIFSFVTDHLDKSRFHRCACTSLKFQRGEGSFGP